MGHTSIRGVTAAATAWAGRLRVGEAYEAAMKNRFPNLWRASVEHIANVLLTSCYLVPRLQPVVLRHLPSRPGITTSSLWWALALGAGFRASGTIIGPASNVVTVALSEKTHTPITSRIWTRAGLPVMIVTCLVGSVLFAIFFYSMSTP